MLIKASTVSDRQLAADNAMIIQRCNRFISHSNPPMSKIAQSIETKPHESANY
jgi:hypothetical protein